jgi:hypothetical protein
MTSNRHERRKAKKFELKLISKEQLAAAGSMCAWDGCEATFKGEMPRGWTILLTYWAKRPVLDLMTLPARDWMRDGVLCPEHTRALESQLKDLSRDLQRAPPIGQG